MVPLSQAPPTCQPLQNNDFQFENEFVLNCKKLWPELLQPSTEPLQPNSAPMLTGCANANRGNFVSQDGFAKGQRTIAAPLETAKISAEYLRLNVTAERLNVTAEIDGLKGQVKDIYRQLSYLLRYWELRKERLQGKADCSDFTSSSSDPLALDIGEVQQVVDLCEAKRALELKSSKVVQALFCKGAILTERGDQEKIWRLVAECHLGFQKVLSCITQRESSALTLNYSPRHPGCTKNHQDIDKRS